MGFRRMGFSQNLPFSSMPHALQEAYLAVQQDPNNGLCPMVLFVQTLSFKSPLIIKCKARADIYNPVPP